MSTSNPLEEELLREFERMVAEGNTPKIELEHRRNCDTGFHRWKWYVGFHTEKYYYCELCDCKDYLMPPPPNYPKL